MLLAQQGLWMKLTWTCQKGCPLPVINSIVMLKSLLVPTAVLPLTEDKLMALIEVPSDFNSEGFDFEMPNG